MDQALLRLRSRLLRLLIMLLRLLNGLTIGRRLHRLRGGLLIVRLRLLGRLTIGRRLNRLRGGLLIVLLRLLGRLTIGRRLHRLCGRLLIVLLRLLGRLTIGRRLNRLRGRLLIVLQRLLGRLLVLRLCSGLWLRREQRCGCALSRCRVHRRDVGIFRRKGLLLTAVALLLRCGELASQLRLFSFGFIKLRLRSVKLRRFMLILFTVAIVLRGGELTRQLVLLEHIGIIIREMLIWLTHLIFARALFSHALRRQFNTIGGQLTTRRHTHAVRTRQLRANALFYLRARRATGETKHRRAGCCCSGS